MPSKAEFDLHIQDQAHDHAGGKDPLWFVVIVALIYAAACVTAVWMLWRVARWLRFVD